MPGAAARDFLVRRICRATSSEAHGHRSDAVELVEGMLHRPEAAACEDRRGAVARRRTGEQQAEDRGHEEHLAGSDRVESLGDALNLATRTRGVKHQDRR